MTDGARGLLAREHRHERRAWLCLAPVLGLPLAVSWSHWSTSGLAHRLLTDAVPRDSGSFGRFRGRSQGWRGDRLALWNIVLRAAVPVRYYSRLGELPLPG